MEILSACKGISLDQSSIQVVRESCCCHRTPVTFLKHLQSHYSELNLSWSTANTICRSESTSVELTNSTIVPLVHRPQLPKCNYYSNSTSYLRRYYATAAFHWSCHNFYRRRCLRSQLFVFRFASRLQCLSQHPQVGDYQNTFRKQYGWLIEHVYTR